MNLHEMKSISRKSKKRLGRGNGSGLGKTCGKGQNGQQCRSGGSIAPWFEGGQMPLYRRLPRRGFNNTRFTTRYQLVHLNDLSQLNSDSEITLEILKENNIIDKLDLPVKIMGDGQIEKSLKIKAHKFTKTAEEKIKKAGGEAITL